MPSAVKVAVCGLTVSAARSPGVTGVAALPERGDGEYHETQRGQQAQVDAVLVLADDGREDHGHDAERHRGKTPLAGFISASHRCLKLLKGLAWNQKLRESEAHMNQN